MKRLVVCFDGTWNGRLNSQATNIARLANCLRKPGDLRSSEFPQQLVLYLPGVGTNYRADQMLGGAFGLGLAQAMRTAYKFLAANLEEDDEVFLFGFSRGAFAARSLANVITFPGLVKASPRSSLFDSVFEVYTAMNRAKSVDQDPMSAQVLTVRRGPKMVERYTVSEALQDLSSSMRREPVKIRFLGVFDTVRAFVRSTLRYPPGSGHSMALSPLVSTARQALAIDEHRIWYAPLLWKTGDEYDPTGQWKADGRNVSGKVSSEAYEPDRVKQVWFQGAHSDVGGGAEGWQNSLADTALLWMLLEAHSSGLEVDYQTFAREIDRNFLHTETSVHPSLKIGFRALDLPLRVRDTVRSNTVVKGRNRIVDPPDGWNVRVASSVLGRRDRPPLAPGEREMLYGFVPRDRYDPPSLRGFESRHPHLDDVVEEVIWLPSAAPKGDDGLEQILVDSFTHAQSRRYDAAEREARIDRIRARVADSHRRRHNHLGEGREDPHADPR